MALFVTELPPGGGVGGGTAGAGGGAVRGGRRCCCQGAVRVLKGGWGGELSLPLIPLAPSFFFRFFRFFMRFPALIGGLVGGSKRKKAPLLFPSLLLA